MKVALVHDYLIDYGGAEAFLASLHEIYPTAPIYVSILDKKGLGRFWGKFSDATIKVSWFNYLPFASRLISPLRFLIPFIWDSFDFSKFDVVITSASWAVTKGMNKGSKTIEICYLHTPPRYLYGYDTSRKWDGKWYRGLISLYSLVVNHFMRMYDFKQAQKVNHFIANSINTGKRIEKFYRRYDYKVIYPPIEVEKLSNQKIDPKPGNYYLTGGRMVASKNFDLIIKACTKLKLNLKIFGTGLEENNLRKLSGKNIEFLGRVSDEELISYYKGAKAFIAAQKDEDFGMTLIEVMATGTPVIAYRGGGYVESVVDGKTGIFFDESTVESLSATIKKFNRMKFKSEDCIKQSQKFSKDRFKKQMKSFVSSKLSSPR